MDSYILYPCNISTNEWKEVVIIICDVRFLYKIARKRILMRRGEGSWRDTRNVVWIAICMRLCTRR